MRLTDLVESKPITEGVRVHSTRLAAYTIALGEAYLNAPVLDQNQLWRWKLFSLSNERLFRKVASRVRVIPSPEDPYQNEQQMLRDIVVNKTLRIYSGGTPSLAFSNAETIIGRAVHDYLSHAITDIGRLKRFLDRQTLASGYEGFEFSQGGGFTVRGEMNACSRQIRLAPRECAGAIFTEILGQASAFWMTGEFPEQKIVLLDQFDYYRIGETKGEAHARTEELSNLLDDPQVEEIHTKVPGLVLRKSELNWSLLSLSTQNRLDKKTKPGQNESIRIDQVNEMAGASRIVGLIRKGVPFCTISASRGNFTPEENAKRTKRLRKYLSGKNVGFVPMDGSWREIDHGVQSEKAFWVSDRNGDPERLFKIACDALILFDQEGACYGNGKEIYFLEPNGACTRIADSASFRPDNIAEVDNFSRIRGHEFTFADRSNPGKLDLSKATPYGG